LTEKGTDASTGAAIDRTYKYDQINRLLSVTDTANPATNTTYSYLQNGVETTNRTSKTVGGVTTNYAYNVLDQLAATNAGNNQSEFDYDYTGMRVKTIGPSGETRFLYDASGALLLQYNAAGKTLVRYTSGNSLLAATNVDPTTSARATQYFLQDA